MMISVVTTMISVATMISVVMMISVVTMMISATTYFVVVRGRTYSCLQPPGLLAKSHVKYIVRMIMFNDQ